ncbi:hypothetical protein [Microbacterium sp.]|uniref:hypothetical protein n=1 Tax=Microbacterium sp. TaxID=51671 RepID=UPI00289A3719|nr:hypothetical protein [Microbacterium sp.]
MSITLTHPGKNRQVTVPDNVADSYTSQGWVAAGSPAPAEQEPVDISTLKVEELKAYAEKHDIDLGDAKKKDEIRAVIEAANSLEEGHDADAHDAEAAAIPADADGGAEDQG